MMIALAFVVLVQGLVLLSLIDRAERSAIAHAHAVTLFKAWEAQLQSQASVNRCSLDVVAALRGELAAHREALALLAANDRNLLNALRLLDLVRIETPTLTVN